LGWAWVVQTVEGPVANLAAIAGSDVGEGGDLKVEAAALGMGEFGSGDVWEKGEFFHDEGIGGALRL
jgi:hypothetical protein